MAAFKSLKWNDRSCCQGLESWRSCWAELIGRTTTSIEVRADRAGAFDASLDFIELASLKMFSTRAPEFEVRRTASSPSVTFARGYKLVLQRSGRTRIRQGDAELVLQGGDWTVYDAGEPYQVSHLETSEQVIVMMPRGALADTLLERPLLRRRDARQGAARSAWVLVCDLFDECHRTNEPPRDAVGFAVSRLLEQAMMEGASPHEPVDRRARIAREIKRMVAEQLHDPQLSLDDIASRVNQTKRSLHRAFADEGETISEYIWRMRVERAKATLECPSSGVSVTDIAFTHGFKSVGHFSRTFKQRVGVSPRSYRLYAQDRAPARAQA